MNKSVRLILFAIPTLILLYFLFSSACPAIKEQEKINESDRLMKAEYFKKTRTHLCDVVGCKEPAIVKLKRTVNSKTVAIDYYCQMHKPN